MRLKFVFLTIALSIGSASVCLSQDELPQSGPAANGEPAWFIYRPAAAPADGAAQNSGPLAAAGGRGARPGGRSSIPDACTADLAKWCSAKSGADGLRCLY